MSELGLTSYECAMLGIILIAGCVVFPIIAILRIRINNQKRRKRAEKGDSRV